MQVREICNSPVQTIGQEANLGTAAQAMRGHDISCLAVTDGGEVVGIITERDLVQAIADGFDLSRQYVASYMTNPVFGAPGDIDAAEAAGLMLQHNVRHLPVLEDGEIVGVVSTRDLLLLEAWPTA
jgi:CBS domain-containing protein